MKHPVLPGLRILGLLVALTTGLLPLRAQQLASARQAPAARPAAPAERKLKDVLNEWGRSRGVNILFEETTVEGLMVTPDRVSPNPLRSSGNLERQLEAVLKPFRLTFRKLKSNSYLVTPLEKPDGPPPAPVPGQSGLAAPAEPRPAPVETSTALPTASQPADVTVSGRVTDEAGAGIPAVNVSVKNTTRGTTTDGTGTYRLAVPDASAVLMFSSVGYERQEIAVGNRTTVDVTMKTDVQGLSEVVVVGYGTQAKKDLSTSVASINSTQIKDLPISNPAQALAGQLPGVYVQQANGAPGAAPVIRIRGTGSLSASNNPLYVIDGYPFNDASFFNTLNPSDIQSIDVLKDAAAAAIYGSRGGNGVVVVTTKRGQAGKTRFDFNAFTGVAQVAKKMRLLDSQEFVDYATEAYRAGNVAIPAVFSAPSKWANTDWQDVIFQAGKVSNYQLAATGGSESVRYAVSGAYFREGGIIVGNDFERFNLNVKLDANLSRRLRLNLDLTPSYATTNQRANSGQVSNSGLIGGITLPPSVSGAIVMPSLIPVRYANGDYGQPNIDPGLTGSFVLQNIFNPLANLEQYHDRTDGTRLWGRMGLDFTLLDGLALNSSLGGATLNQVRNAYRNSVISNLDYQTANVTTPNVTSIAGHQSLNKTLNWVWTNTLTYTKTLGKHRLTALAGVEAQKNTSEFNVIQSRPGTYTNDLVPYISGSSDVFSNAGKSVWALVSYIGRLNYNYADKYLLTAVLRRDGSSRFGPNARFALFPSVSAAWRVTGEPFLQNVTWLSELKLRASYGKTGNFEIGDFPWVATVGVDNYSLGGTRVIGLRPNGFANSDLTWETNRQTDLGLEVGLLQDRIYLTADYYERNTNGLISSRPIPTINGFSASYVTNIGNIRNRGLELGLTTQNTRSGGALQWTTNLNVSFNRNLVTALVNGQTIINTPIFGWNNTHRISEGRPLGDLYGYVLDGIFQNQSEADAGPKWNGVTGKPGDPKYRDLNGDGRITTDDITTIGNSQPDFTYGITNTLRYRGFDLNVIMQGVQGGDITNAVLRFENTFTGRVNATGLMLNRWRSPEQPGDGITPRVTTNTVEGGIREFSSRFIYDASFFRIRNVTLGYALPLGLVQKARLQSARIYVSAQNLATFSKYFGYSPEVSQQGENVNALGIDQGTYPIPRTVTVGLNVGF